MTARNLLKFLIYAIFSALPFLIQIPGIIPGKNIPLIDIIMISIIFVSLFDKLRFKFEDLPTVFLMTAFCSTVLMSGAFGSDAGGYIKVSIQYFISYVILFLILSNLRYIFDKRLTRVYLYASTISVFLISLYYHFDLTILPEILNYNVTGGIFYRVGFTGVNDHAYILAGSVLSFIIANEKLKFGDICLITFIIYGILITGSRSAMFFLLIGFLIYFITSKKIPIVAKLTFMIMVFSLMAFILQMFVIENRIFQMFELRSRLLFLDAINSDNLGILGGSSANFTVDNMSIHINVIQILLSSGILSLFLYLTWYLTIVMRSYNRKNLSLILIIILIFLFYQQIGHIYERNLFLVFAIIYFTGLNRKNLLSISLSKKKKMTSPDFNLREPNQPEYLA